MLINIILSVEKVLFCVVIMTFCVYLILVLLFFGFSGKPQAGWSTWLVSTTSWASPKPRKYELYWKNHIKSWKSALGKRESFPELISVFLYDVSKITHISKVLEEPSSWWRSARCSTQLEACQKSRKYELYWKNHIKSWK